MNDSTKSQDEESTCSGKVSHVPSHPAVVPSPRKKSMSSRDRSTPLDTWNLSGTQGNVFLAIHVPCSLHHRHCIKEFLHSSTPSATGGIPVQRSTGRPVARMKNELGAQFQFLCLQESHQPLILFLPAEIPHNSVAVQQRQQISKIQFHKFLASSTFLCW